MEELRARSGSRIIVASGQITTFEGQPLRLEGEGLRLEFRFHTEPGCDAPWARLDHASEPGTVVVHCVNFDQVQGRGTREPLALPAEPRRWLHFRVFHFGETVDRTVHYTIFAPAAVRSEGARGEQSMASEDDQRALAEARAAAPSPTRRPTVPALEERLFEPVPVLDHGFVRVVDYMGDDAAIVQAARVSYGKGTKSVSDDRGLVRYLVRHRHTTPLEMCELKLHVKLPIFVARQWIRHRTANVNEISARYSILDREFYLPEPEQVKVQSATNRQGRGEALSAEQAARVLDVLRRDAVQAFDTYDTLLNDRGDGQPVDPELPQVARELARSNLTLGTYTQWYWKIDLHNLMHFVGLRADAHAQYEIRVYAEVIADIVAAWVPHAWEAFVDYRQHAHTFSREEMEVLRKLVQGADPDAVLPETTLSGRERIAFRKALGLGMPSRRRSEDPT